MAQLLAAPVLEEPEEELPAAGVEELVELLELLGLLSVELVELDEVEELSLELSVFLAPPPPLLL